MSAALAATEKGHSVTLYEQNNRLGGQLHLAGSPPGRDEFINLAKDLESQLHANGIKIILGQKVDQALIQQENPDAVILATGAIPTTPPIEGVNAPYVVQAWDVLMDKVITGQHVVIIGGGAVGVETALFLAEKGTLSGDAVKFLLVNRAESPERLYELATQGTKKITIIEMVNKVGRDIGKSTRWAMIQDIKKLNIDIRLEAKALEINSNGIRIEQRGEVTELPADTVVLATGAVSYNELGNDLKNLDIPYKIIGDANRIGLAFNAVHQGYAAGFEI
jgi:2,4-dienoyl-CoA reductase (NADPH2)